MKEAHLAKLHKKLTHTALASVLTAGVLTLVAMILEKFMDTSATWMSVIPFLISLATALATATVISSVMLSFYRMSDNK